MEQQIAQILKKNHDLIENQSSSANSKWRQLLNENSLQLDIYEHKKFFRNEIGWQWYKNLVIPSMKITSNDLKNQIQGSREDSSQIQISLLCYKKLSSSLYDLVHLDGQSQRSFSKGKAQFKSLKFEETSFMSRSQYFLLTIAVYTQKHILSLYVSPKISVDARKKYWQERQTQGQIFDPFLPKYIELNKQKLEDESDKLPDLKNLYKYFTCSTIRHKIRHPFFLLFQFPEAVRLLYNTNLVKVEEGSRNLLLEIQKQLYLAFKNSGTNQTHLENRPMVLQIRKEAYLNNPNASEMIKYIDKYLGGIDSPAVCYQSQNIQRIPDYYEELECSDDLIDMYCKNYSSMIYLKFLTICDEDDEENAFVQLNKLQVAIDSNEEYSLTKELNKKIQTVIEVKPKKTLKQINVLRVKAIHPQIYQEEIKKKIKSQTVISDDEIPNYTTHDDYNRGYPQNYHYQSQNQHAQQKQLHPTQQPMMPYGVEANAPQVPPYSCNPPQKPFNPAQMISQQFMNQPMYPNQYYYSQQPQVIVNYSQQVPPYPYGQAPGFSGFYPSGNVPGIESMNNIQQNQPPVALQPYPIQGQMQQISSAQTIFQSNFEYTPYSSYNKFPKSETAI